MNSELQTKVVNWLETAAQKVGEFASNEIPPFIHEYLNWKFLEAALNAGLFMIPVLIGFYVLLKWKSLLGWAKKYSNDSEGFSWLGFVFSLLGAVALIVCFFPKSEILDMVQIKIAPKVYLVTKAHEIIKGQ